MPQVSWLVCQRQMLIVRFGVRILLETRKKIRLDNSILNEIEVPLKIIKEPALEKLQTNKTRNIEFIFKKITVTRALTGE